LAQSLFERFPDSFNRSLADFANCDITFIGCELMPAICATDQTIIYRRIVRILWLVELCAAASGTWNCDIAEVNVAHNLAPKNIEKKTLT
jgi:hypothetical protein